MSHIIARIEGRIGHLTLNRPQALNALNLEMCEGVLAALAAWEADPEVRLVLLDGAGERGLCAGGDIRAVYDAIKAGTVEPAGHFFGLEYRMNGRIAAFQKPFVAFMDGIVMGGGIGIAGHGSHRVVTERSLLAMPETGIGFYPDVGALWLLSRAPGELGTHLALTAARIGPADAILCGLADACVPAAGLSALAGMLGGSASAAEIGTQIAAHAIQPPPGELVGARSWIDAAYGHDSVEAIVAALEASPEPAARAAAAAIASKSPTSLKVTFRALRNVRGFGSLDECLAQDYRLALAFLSAPDFPEGIRAAVVDKDRNPRWSPATLAEVPAATVDRFFASYP